MTHCGKRAWLPSALALGVVGALFVSGSSGPAHGDDKLVADNNTLAFDLYARLGKVKPTANLAFSPYSIAEVMVLPTCGAGGGTAEQLARALHFNEPVDRLPTAYAAMDRALAGETIRTAQPSRIGLRVGDTPDGVKIEEVLAGSPADKAGLKKDRVIIAVEGHKVKTATDYYSILADLAGDTFTLETRFGHNSTEPYRLTAPKVTANPYRLVIANAAWGRKGLLFRPEFLAAAQELGAAVEDVDFADPATRQLLNDWIAHKTEGSVKELLPPDTLKPDTGLVLTNALYFRAQWDQEFSPGATTTASFTLLDKTTMKVPMMDQQGSFRIYSGSDFKIIELPFHVGDVVLDLILPDKAVALEEFEKQSFTAENLTGWLGRMSEKSVRLRLPRFKAECQFDLKETLGEMGVVDAFGPKADFSRMTSEKDLALSVVLHQAMLEVDERGATASAASVASFRPKGIKVDDTQFIADHPFLFVLRDRTSNVILFLGRVTEPEKAQ